MVSDAQRGTNPRYPDLRHASTAGPAGAPPEHSEHDIDRIAAERSREDEALGDTNAHPCGAVCSVGAASGSERPTSAGVGTVEVPVPDDRAQPLRIAQRGQSEAPDRALATLVVAVQELDREDPR